MLRKRKMKPLTVPSIFYAALLICFFIFSQDLIFYWRSYSSLVPVSSNQAESRCMSRSQLPLYRRSKLSSSSEALHSAWRNYQIMQRTCTAGKNWSVHLHADNDQCKYLFFLEPNVGLGNRILSLVSAALYALITDRVLMVDRRISLTSVLCEPFEGSSWGLPQDFPVGALDIAPLLQEAVAKNFTNVNLVRLKLDHVQTETEKLFFCDEVQLALDGVQNLVWSSNQYFVTGLFQVPVLWKKLVLLFVEGNAEVFAQVARLFISPENDVWWLATKFYREQQIFSSKMLLGLQIRPHYRPNITAFDPYVNKLVQECLQETLMLPRTVTSRGVQELDQSFADYSVLVSSLQGNYFESLRRLYQSRTEDGKSVRVHSLSQEGAERHTRDQDKLALAEMMLLSFSDHIVASEFSTFGYVASGMAGLRPFFLGVQESVGCFRSRSSQPCTHFPQTPRCGSLSENQEHKKWLESHVKYCQDHQIGLQLV